MKPIKTEMLTEKILLEQTHNHIHVQFDTPYQVISSAVLNGGLVEASHILNKKVAKQPEGLNSDFQSPDGELSTYSEQCGWKGITAGMMTAASMDSYRK